MNARDKAEEIRRMIFDPSVPDWAFLSEDDLVAAFGCATSTLRRWSNEAKFPRPIELPGTSVYTLASIREFLKKRAAESKRAAVAILK